MVLPRCSPSLLPFPVVVVLNQAQDFSMEWIRLEQTLCCTHVWGVWLQELKWYHCCQWPGLPQWKSSSRTCHPISSTNFWHRVGGTGLLTRLGDRPQSAGHDGSCVSTQVSADSNFGHSTKITPQTPRLSLLARLNLLLRPTIPRHSHP